MIDQIIAFNKTFVEQKSYEKYLTDSYTRENNRTFAPKNNTPMKTTLHLLAAMMLLLAASCQHGTQQETNDSKVTNNPQESTVIIEEKDGVSIIWLPVSLVIGLLVGFLIINGIASKNKSVKMQENATVYTRPGSMVITGSADNFLYNNVERREKPKQTENQNN